MHLLSPPYLPMRETIFFVKRKKFIAATYNLRADKNLVHLGRLLHFSQKVVGLTLKTEVFISNFQFTCRAKFSDICISAKKWLE